MNSIARFVAIYLAAHCVAAQEPAVPLRPEWRITLRVIDEAGQPVEGAHAQVGFSVPGVPGEPIPMEQVVGETDANGLFTASGRALHRLFCSAQKSGYYMTALPHNLNALFDKPRHEPWNPTLPLILKKKINPIGMYAKSIRGGPPVFNQAVGYDLTVGDWVGPHGKGKMADIVFFGQLDRKAKEDFVYKLTVNFPNPGDGVQEFRVPHRFGEGSELRSPHEAPSGGYEPQVVRTMSRHPGQPSEDNSDRERNYFFRVRTVLNQNGEVESAHYGKIYGDFMQFRYYLNPTPNSRNVEFDPKQNLLKNLKSTERVDAP